MKRQVTANQQPMGSLPALLANALVFGILGYMAYLEASHADFYRMSVQEDEYLEWATFWAFIGAAWVAFRGALNERRELGNWPWFLAGVSFFCFVVAMEEISWAQRLIDYRPPTYFLEHNFQQEPNFHNVISTGLRKLALKSVIAGYGIVLPILALVPPLGSRLRKWSITAPPIELVPSFAATLWLYVDYPWDYSGEIVEVMLGFCFLFGLLASRRPSEAAGTRRKIVTLGISWLIVMALGLATAAAARFQTSARLENVDAARVELEALKNDFLHMSNPHRNIFPTRCGIHKRVYSYVEKYDKDYLWRGQFASLQGQGLREERAKFFIDPWNAPYWVRDRCNRDRTRRSIFVYSFGPNRRRDSSVWEVLGDDVGAYILIEGE